MAKALRIASEQERHYKKLVSLREVLITQLKTIEGVVINSPENHAAPHIVNFSIPKTKPEVVVQSLTAKEVYVSTKSACSSKLSAPSRVLSAMGLSEERASSGIRVSFSYETTKQEVDQFIKELKVIIPELREVINS
jgi:cysteine desulfurase